MPVLAPKPVPAASLTRSERIARDRLFRHLWEGRDDHLSEAMREQVPEAWHTLEYDLDVTEPKVKLTLYLDASTAKFYRAMGPGYQGRINRILATWAQMKIAGLIATEAHMAKRMDALMAAERARMGNRPPAPE